MRRPDAMPATRRRLATLAAGAAVVLAIAPAPAHAGSDELLRDACRDEKVDGTYSQKDYREALANIPADADQYTNCRDVIRAAQLAAASSEGAGAGGAAGGIGGGIADPLLTAGGDPLATATPEEKAAVQQAVRQAVRQGAAPVQVGGETVEPSSLGAGREVAASVSDLPPPLLAVLGLVALAALGALVLVALPRVRARRHA